MNEDND